MESELLALEVRVREAVDLCNRLQVDNQALRQRLAMLENENRQLQGKIDSAASQLEQLLNAATPG